MTVITSTNADTEFSKSFPYRDSPHRKKLNHTCYWGMKPVLLDSVGMNIFFFGIESAPDERIKKVFV